MTTFTDACDTIARSASQHIRITHTIAEGRMDRAADLLRERMINLIRDWLEGDIKGDLALACAKVHAMPGPVIMTGLALAANREVHAIRV